MPALLTYPSGAAVVFGGSGGAGSHIVRAFAQAGCDVAFTYLTAEGAALSLQRELEHTAVRISIHQVDITDAQIVADALGTIASEHGGIHTVVYASGPRIDVMHILANTPARFRFIVEAELVGFFHILHAALPHLKASRGNVVACVTYANKKVLPNDGQSASPKAGIESLVRQVAVEEGGSGVRANAVALGWLNVGQGAIDATDRSNVQSDIGKQMLDYMTSLVPLGKRPGRGEELAAAVLFLASQQASYITGQTLTVDGGAAL